MIDPTLQESADEFVRVLAANPVVSAFHEAKALMEGDEKLSAMRDQHARMVEEFRTKQSDGTLVQQDISKLRSLYNEIAAYPANARFAAARDQALELLRSCNEAISGLLGFDFAANAAPAASC